MIIFELVMFILDSEGKENNENIVTDLTTSKSVSLKISTQTQTSTVANPKQLATTGAVSSSTAISSGN
jgi:hypothetical protein